MAVTSLWLAWLKLGPLGGPVILLSLARSGLAAAGMGLGLYAVLKLGTMLPAVWVLFACTAAGLVIYAAISYLIKTPELRVLISFAVERMSKTGVQG
jgi:hypothetical protein